MYRQQNLQTYVKYFYPQTDYFISNVPLSPYYEKEKASEFILNDFIQKYLKENNQKVFILSGNISQITENYIAPSGISSPIVSLPSYQSSSNIPYYILFFPTNSGDVPSYNIQILNISSNKVEYGCGYIEKNKFVFNLTDNYCQGTILLEENSFSYERLSTFNNYFLETGKCNAILQSTFENDTGILINFP